MWVAYPAADAAEQAAMMACIINEYSAEVRYMDDEVGRLWTQFETDGLLDDTLVVFFSDHGEQFDEHGRFQHTWSLYREENAAVAAFWAKNIQPMTWSGPTIHQDLAPTILDALEVPLGSHTGVIVGTAPADRALVTFNAMLDWGGTLMAAEKDGQKLIYWWNGGKKYFDLSIDPTEVTDLYDPADPSVLALWTVLDAKIDEARAFWPDLVPTDAEP
jgi:arylsulfatase A-like enzyme